MVNFNDLMPAQSELQQKPVTIASAASVSPITALSFVSGTTDIATVVPPVEGYHELKFQFTDATPPDILTTGNVEGLTSIAQDEIVLLIYNPITETYFARNLG